MILFYQQEYGMQQEKLGIFPIIQDVTEKVQ